MQRSDSLYKPQLTAACHAKRQMSDKYRTNWRR